MRRLLVLMTGLAALAVTVRAQAPPTTPDQAPRVEAAEVKRLLEKREAVLVDVRGKEAWDAGHADGAIHIPEAQILSRLSELPKTKLIALYCT